MQRSKSFTSIAFDQKRKGVTRKSSPQRQSRPKPEWNDYLTDPNRFKVSEDDLLKKKRLLVSKNNILAPEYQPPSVRSAMATPRKSESSQSTPRKTPREEHRRTHEASSPAVQRQDRPVSSLDLLRESQSLAEDASSDESRHNDFDSDRDDDDGDAASAFERRSAQVEEASMAHLDSDDDDEPVRKSSTMKMAAKRTRTPIARDHDHHRHRHHHSHREESGASAAAASPSPRPTTWGSASRALSSASPVNKRVGKPHSSSTPASHSTSSVPPPPPVTAAAAPHHTAKFVERSDRIGDDDLLDIARNIDHLQQELRMYEEIAGKKSILDAEELQLILGTDEHGTLNVDALNQKTVIRYLVSLVCQTMTYTLQSEVKQQHLESEMSLMQSKMDDVLRLLHQQQQQQTSASYSRFVLSAPPMLASLPVPPPPPAPPATSTAYDHVMAAHQTDEARYEERWSTPIASSAWASPDTAVAPAPPAAAAAAAAAATPHAPTTPFYGTSTSDWLFMRNSPAVAAAPQQQQPSPVKAASMPYAATPKAASSASPAAAVAAAAGAAEAFQTPTYEYNLSPETAADLASRTYDMYVAQQQQQQQKRTMPSSSSSSSRASDSGLGELDHYDEMIDRLSYQFSSTKAAKYYPPPPPPPSSAGTAAASTFPSDGVSIVVPHATAPTPSKPSPHPFQVAYTRSSGGGNALFPASPPTAKKIYDASLGNYSLVDDTYDDA